MKRPVLLILLALVVGFGLGLFFTHGIVAPSRNSALAANNMMLASAPAEFSPLPSETAVPLDQSDDTLLLERADQALTVIRDGDYESLSDLVHPTDGVTFTPYSTVDPDCNQMLNAGQVARLEGDKTVYTWGLYVGNGTPIQMTGKEYFARYVFNTDYSQAPQVSFDHVLATGNALENVVDTYPDCRFVEYYFPGLDQKNQGFDWCSLKLIFKPHQEVWYLVGIIHSEWTP